MASKIGICNRALNRIGARQITSMDDGTKSADACKSCYDDMREEVLRSHTWNCVSTRASIAAVSSTPDWGYDRAFQLPSDCLRVTEVDGDYDWVVEGREILTDELAPLDIQYIRNSDDPNEYDALLRAAIAARIAVEIVEYLTQSTSKKADAMAWWEDVMLRATAADGQEQRNKEFEEDTWLSVR